MASSTAKFAALATLLLVLVSLVHASIYKTIVGGQSEQCREEVSQQSLQSCQMYLQKGQPRLIMVGRNEGDVPNECCQQLRDVREECRCDALNEVVQEQIQRRQQQEGGHLGEKERQKIVRRAVDIPYQCDVKVDDPCDISVETD